MTSAAFKSLMALLLPLYCLSLCTVCVTSAPVTTFDGYIPSAGGVALSSDGSRAFISTVGFNSLYVVDLPFNASSEPKPTPYWKSTGFAFVTSISASLSTSPSVVYLLDSSTSLLLSLTILPTPPVDLSLVYSFGSPTHDWSFGGMSRQSSSELLYFTVWANDDAAFDSIAMLDPTSPNPTLNTIYITPYSYCIGGLVVSSSRVYFGIMTSLNVRTNPTVAQIWAFDLASPKSSSLLLNTPPQPELLYTTRNSNVSDLSVGDLVFPGGFALNADETILYISDLGNIADQPWHSPHGLYALYPLTSSGNLTTIYGFAGSNVLIQQSIALAPDQSTLYFATQGNNTDGLYFIADVNSSIPLNSANPMPPTPPTPLTPPTSTSVDPPSVKESTASVIRADVSRRPLPIGGIVGSGLVGVSQSSASLCAVKGWTMILLTFAVVALLW